MYLLINRFDLMNFSVNFFQYALFICFGKISAKLWNSCKICCIFLTQFLEC